MFPEMMLRASDCAEAPDIEFESAAKRPIGVSVRETGTGGDPTSVHKRPLWLTAGVWRRVAGDARV
jgi:hypothetical protein